MPDGKVTSFPLATQTVAFLRVTTRDAGWNAMMDSPAMKMDDMPFGGMRITWRGFTEFVTARAD